MPSFDSVRVSRKWKNGKLKVELLASKFDDEEQSEPFSDRIFDLEKTQYFSIRG